MRITFGKNDPRAGMTVEMADEARAKALIESGAATKASGATVTEAEAPADATLTTARADTAPAAKAPARKATKTAKKAR